MQVSVGPPPNDEEFVLSMTTTSSPPDVNLSRTEGPILGPFEGLYGIHFFLNCFWTHVSWNWGWTVHFWVLVGFKRLARLVGIIVAQYCVKRNSCCQDMIQKRNVKKFISQTGFDQFCPHWKGFCTCWSQKRIPGQIFVLCVISVSCSNKL